MSVPPAVRRTGYRIRPTPLGRALLVGLAIAWLAGACGRGGSEGTTGTEEVAATSAGNGSDVGDGSTPAVEVTSSEGAAPAADPDDNDQDGVADGDNCAGVFNPDQADDDGDGIGNACDETVQPSANLCDFSDSLVEEVQANGDEATTSICLPLQVEDPELPVLVAGLGSVLLETDQFVLIDLTDEQLAEARTRGLETVSVETLAGRDAADLAALRIERDPDDALDTVDLDVLSDVPPETLERVPVEVLADQPDETLARMPDAFWLIAPEATIVAVGPDRLARLNPRIVIDPDLLEFPTLDPGSSNLPSGTGSATTTTTAATASTTTTTTSTATAGGDG